MERGDQVKYPPNGEVFENSRCAASPVIEISGMRKVRCPYCGKVLFETGELTGTLRILCKSQYCRRFLTFKFMPG